ncbi:dTMP kinase [Pueribacillus theae]|uniref:Thymidylate kinase n=1 Tax=Pueribacillus theae TaxID=2171751 RepID=A0A2U1K3L7_9BACI|nr:dTMP kinase [Pueribacillus theae]PWA12101.1 dTMP kinase [Pueribacillus theae]
MQGNGRFITFEGPDGAGKTTQIKKLAAYLKEKEKPFLLTREPGGTRISDAIRSLILHPGHTEMMKETEVLLYAASRAQHVREKIIPALEKGVIVLCDRFVDASIAYQGYGLEIGVQKILEINDFATGGLTPDRSYLLDISPEQAQKRLIARSGETLDRIEQKGIEYHKQVRYGFLELYKQHRDRILLLDGHQSEEAIFSLIKKDFESI